MRANSTRLTGGLAVDAVAGIADPVLRNLCITQAYADLGGRLQRLLGDGDATWCAFGVWASNTAGMSIRKEEVRPALVRLLDEAGGHHEARAAVNHRLRDLCERGAARLLGHSDLVHGFDAALAEVSGQIAAGNALVFSELSPLFVRFVSACEHAPPTADDAERFLADIGVTGVDAQAPEPGLLAGAFRHYHDAVLAGEPARRSQLVLAANLAAVLHEQQRLQEAIRAALDAGAHVLDAALDRIVIDCSAGDGRHHGVRRAAGQAMKHLEAEIDRIWEQVCTLLLMRLFTADEVLHLGEDLPPLPSGAHLPEHLAALDGPAAAMVARLDRTGGTGRGSAARDWADLDERMNYIVNLFRSRQRHPPVRSQPFSPEQAASIRERRMPPGPFIRS